MNISKSLFFSFALCFFCIFSLVSVNGAELQENDIENAKKSLCTLIEFINKNKEKFDFRNSKENLQGLIDTVSENIKCNFINFLVLNDDIDGANKLRDCKYLISEIIISDDGKKENGCLCNTVTLASCSGDNRLTLYKQAILELLKKNKKADVDFFSNEAGYFYFELSSLGSLIHIIMHECVHAACNISKTKLFECKEIDFNGVEISGKMRFIDLLANFRNFFSQEEDNKNKKNIEAVIAASLSNETLASFFTCPKEPEISLIDSQAEEFLRTVVTETPKDTDLLNCTKYIYGKLHHEIESSNFKLPDFIKNLRKDFLEYGVEGFARAVFQGLKAQMLLNQKKGVPELNLEGMENVGDLNRLIQIMPDSLTSGSIVAFDQEGNLDIKKVTPFPSQQVGLIKFPQRFENLLNLMQLITAEEDKIYNFKSLEEAYPSWIDSNHDELKKYMKSWMKLEYKKLIIDRNFLERLKMQEGYLNKLEQLIDKIVDSVEFIDLKDDQFYDIPFEFNDMKLKIYFDKKNKDNEFNSWEGFKYILSNVIINLLEHLNWSSGKKLYNSWMNHRKRMPLFMFCNEDENSFLKDPSDINLFFESLKNKDKEFNPNFSDILSYFKLILNKIGVELLPFSIKVESLSGSTLIFNGNSNNSDSNLLIVPDFSVNHEESKSLSLAFFGLLVQAYNHGLIKKILNNQKTFFSFCMDDFSLRKALISSCHFMKTLKSVIEKKTLLIWPSSKKDDSALAKTALIELQELQKKHKDYFPFSMGRTTVLIPSINTKLAFALYAIKKC